MTDWHSLSESELLTLISQHGDQQAFGELYERHFTPIFRYVFARLESRVEAEDMTEEIFIKIWRALPSYQQEGLPFSAFVFRVAQNTLIDYCRKAGRKPKSVSLDDDATQFHELLANPLDVVNQRMEAKTLRDALTQLSDDYREVLVLRFLDGLSPQETAHTMQRSEGAVRVLQHRALGALRKILQPLAGVS